MNANTNGESSNANTVWGSSNGSTNEVTNNTVQNPINVDVDKASEDKKRRRSTSKEHLLEEWEGTPLLDILNIIYLGADDVSPEDQVGTIKLFCFNEVHDIYKVDYPKSTLKYGDTINVRLDGPIPSCGCLDRMEFNLFRGAYNGEIDLQWEPEDGELYVLQQTLYSTDKTGKIHVQTARYANAIEANLEVKLLTSAATNVYGGIFASNTRKGRPSCANVLFLEKPRTGINIGMDGVITLSKSCVAVPLHSELNVDLSLYLDAACHIKKTLAFNPNKLVDVKYVPVDKETATISVRVTWGRKIMLVPCDSRIGFEVEEGLALEFQSLTDQIKRSDEIAPRIKLPGISRSILRKAIDYFRLSDNNFEADSVQITDRDGLINLIQAAHFFKIKSLLDFHCKILVDKVRKRDPKAIMEEFNTAHFNYLKSHDRVLRQRRKETLINRWRLVTVLIPSYATKQLVTVERWNSVFDGYLKYMSFNGDLEELRKVFLWLIDFIKEDIKFADRLRNTDVKMLFGFLKGTDRHMNKEIQGLAVKLLSYVISREKHRHYFKEGVEEFIELMSLPSIDMNIAGVDALTCIAYALPSCIKVILNEGALKRAHELLPKAHHLGLKTSSDLILCVANFLAAVCCGNSDSNKVKLALDISEDLFQKKLSDNEHKVLACYALQYLTYENPVKIEEATWKKLIENLIKFSMVFDGVEDIAASSKSRKLGPSDTGLAASAIGVVGNIARWGDLDQIQSLAVDAPLMECLRKMLCSGIKKFCKEACQIISNIAARHTEWIHEMAKFDLIEPLCNLLLEEVKSVSVSVSDVKLEAAWAIFNGIYGRNQRQIDEYPSDNESDGDKMRLSP